MKTPESRNNPEYNFESGIKAAMERIQSLLAEKDVVLVGINGSDTNVGKTRVGAELSKLLNENQIPNIRVGGIDIIKQNEHKVLSMLAESDQPRGVIIFTAQMSGSYTEDQLTKLKQSFDDDAKEAASRSGLPFDKVDLMISIYRPDKPFVSADENINTKPIGDIIIRNEKAIDKDTK